MHGVKKVNRADSMSYATIQCGRKQILSYFVYCVLIGHDWVWVCLKPQGSMSDCRVIIGSAEDHLHLQREFGV